MRESEKLTLWFFYPLIPAFSRREKGTFATPSGGRRGYNLLRHPPEGEGEYRWSIREFNGLHDVMILVNPFFSLQWRYHWPWLLCLLCLPAMATAQLHHDLEVTISPGQHGLTVSDTLSWSGDSPASLEFTLHAALGVETTTPGAQLTELPDGAAGRLPALNGEIDPADLKTRRYRATLPAGETQLNLRYEGSILHALQQRGGEYARSFSTTRGTISGQGVFLAGPSAWYPQVDGELITFDLHIRLPGAVVRRQSGDARDARGVFRPGAGTLALYLTAGRDLPDRRPLR